MLRYFVALLTTAACLAADPAIAIQIRMISAESDHAITAEVNDDQGQPVNGATVSFQLQEKSVQAQTKADGRASIAATQLSPNAGAFEVKVTAVKDQARAGLITHQIIAAVPAALPATPSPTVKLEPPKSAPVMPVTAGGDGDFRTSHSFHWKWLTLLGLVAGAGAGLYLKAQANSTVTLSSPLLAAPQVGTPSITIGHP
jgi:hypothetical protein